MKGDEMFFSLKIRGFFALFLLLFFVSCTSTKEENVKYPVRVLIVNFFEIGQDTGDIPGERQLWIEKLGLNEKLDFPTGKAPLYYNPKSQVLNMLTQQANINSALGMMALGLDPRFDLSKAYVLLAGIAGGDPKVISLGSAVWSRYIVDGDLMHSIDPREMPKGWKDGAFGYLNTAQEEKFQGHLGTDYFEINPNLLKWAYQLTKGVQIPDEPQIQRRRALYTNYQEAQKKPRIAIGDNVAASDYWHGQLATEWARRWVSYLTEGKGEFFTSAMEDTGVLSAIAVLSKNHLMDYNRVLVLRTISNYTMQWPGATAYQSFMGDKDGYSGLQASVQAAYLVGSPVVKAIIDNWEQYKNQIP